MSRVSIQRLPEADYVSGCVALPKHYGTAAWEEQPEVAAIRTAVFDALNDLEEETGISSSFSDRHVLVKPNLVLVYHKMGTVKDDYPETTDPRVLDAVVLWISKYAGKITIVESSGRGSPTRSSFVISGIDRLAKHRGCGLVALEDTPSDRYILPKAKVQKEILVPRIFSEVVRGDAAYVSVPKLKTNLYTAVTLGFKNAMGVIPYNLRQRNHTYAIDRKLVEMLYLFKPDLVLIDGVVGGEGECPAPVDPVDSRMIIAGNHPVETDRVATRLMGFNPDEITLMQVADELGFGDPDHLTVRGDTTPVPFRPADASLVSHRVRATFPNLRVLIGIDKVDPSLPKDHEFVHAMETSCRGGCVATTRFGLGMLEAEGVNFTKPATVIIGSGIEIDGKRWWYDADGKACDRQAALSGHGKTAVIGTCGEALAADADYYVAGCMPMPNSPHSILHVLAGTPCRVMSLKNKQLFRLLGATLKSRSARRRMIRQGVRFDVPLRLKDGIVETRELTEDEKGRDWVEWPLPPIDPKEKKKLLAFEDDAVAAAFLGELKFNFLKRVFWKSQVPLTAAVTLAPLILAVLSALVGRPVGLDALRWLTLFAAIEALHILELPLSFRTRRAYHERNGLAWTGARKAATLVGTLLAGFPLWVPYKTGVFDNP